MSGDNRSPNLHPSPLLGTKESSPVAVSPVSIGPGPPPPPWAKLTSTKKAIAALQSSKSSFLNSNTTTVAPGSPVNSSVTDPPSNPDTVATQLLSLNTLAV